MNEISFRFCPFNPFLLFPLPRDEILSRTKREKKLKNKIIIITITILHEIVFVITIFIIAN